MAQKLLAAHDAAELVFMALLAHSNTRVLSSNGQVIKDPSFFTMADTALGAAAAANKTFEAGAKLSLFEKLLEARKLFKHSGILVDTTSNDHIFEDVVQTLDEMCKAITGTSLFDSTEPDVIQNDEIRDRFKQAQEMLESKQFKRAMETTAQALCLCFWHLNTPTQVQVGTASSEEALLLAGRGIDPAAFLLMQRLLPITHFGHEDCEWELRKFGHPGNWTKEKAEYCLRTALDTAVKLQSSKAHPFLHDFYNFYEDVVEITASSPEVWFTSSYWFSTSFEETTLATITAGDQITGKASGRIEKAGNLREDNEMDLEFAIWIAIEDASSDKLPASSDISKQVVVWVRKDDVRVTHRINVWKAKWSENPDWTYENMSEWHATADLDEERLRIETLLMHR